MLGLKDTSPLSRWEKGQSLPSLLDVFRLSRIYKTLPAELYGDLWQRISLEIQAREADLLTLSGSFTNTE